VRDEDGRAPVGGWAPPVDSEGLWAEPLGGGTYRIANTPWFADNLAHLDVIEALDHWVIRKNQWSGHLTVRVAHPRPSTVLEVFAGLGVRGESAGPAYAMAALDIAPDADLRAIVTRLRAGQADGIWDYEEACVSAEWRRL
jgi:hypothetical protein